ncbi:alpha/beta hydrolase [Helcococcus kunzii]|uniref:alpha/beta hydrolase n=1 Tax=Helcococcus kunzii TaxID=40091 RepID=UPI001BB09768|nr:alpha/beta hydrolase-fold protein [Helcococcus kunzii]MCT1796115.1 alpha/beta hydrolase-fold protein [Helcococcus kunzii]MCT1989481.1 alpha/beta hydrolase-fold protein [Helcococcus kunzii]QUY64398.1 prolyl oligopeptidase family serine peptidase [Helcococcus kunzii]
MKKTILPILLSILVLLSACTPTDKDNQTKEETDVKTETNMETESEKESVEETEAVGKFGTTTIWSEQLKLDWNVSSYIPDEFDPNNVKVMYMLHGAFGNHTNFNERTKTVEYLNQYNKKHDQKLIAVFVDGFNSFYIDKNINMESAIVKDLIPTFEKMNEIKIDRNNRFVSGISMGGYGTLNFMFKHSDLFSKGYAISPVVAEELDTSVGIGTWNIFYKDGKFDKEAYKNYHPLTNLENNKDKLKDIEVYLYAGKQDQVVLLDDVNSFLEKAKDKVKIKEKIIDGEHSWDFWDQEIKAILENDI